jgi:hypothetical protein
LDTPLAVLALRLQSAVGARQLRSVCWVTAPGQSTGNALLGTSRLAPLRVEAPVLLWHLLPLLMLDALLLLLESLEVILMLDSAGISLTTPLTLAT